MFDTRAAPPSACVKCIELSGKVFAAAASNTTVVVATSNRRLMALDAANGGAVLMDKESPLKYQTRCVACFPSGAGMALGSVEGRVAIEPLGRYDAHVWHAPCRTHHSAPTKPFAFKCHRATSEGKQVVYPVNALAFHPTYSTFATGGAQLCCSVLCDNNMVQGATGRWLCGTQRTKSDWRSGQDTPAVWRRSRFRMMAAGLRWLAAICMNRELRVRAARPTRCMCAR